MQDLLATIARDGSTTSSHADMLDISGMNSLLDVQELLDAGERYDKH